jgi:hypothetical protein
MKVPSTHGDGSAPRSRGSRQIRILLAKRRWRVLVAAAALVVGVAVPAVSFADTPSGCDFAASGTTQSCSTPLAGSAFAGGDGNLATSPTAFGTVDWQNVANLNAGIDLASGGSDNAFGQGTKEDNANVTVVSGSIPPNKSDLTRFYEASEFANGSNFLYLAWERTNVLGSANMDFEINQAATPGLGSPGAHTINRTAGDLLVTFDFTNGGGRPTLGLLTWVTSGPTSQCFSSNSLPCWGNHVDLNSTDSIGAVNNLDAVSDPIAPNAPRSLPALTFGEAAINLTAAGVFPTGTCEALGSAFLKSRASASFGAEVKDFVAPVGVNISNCGTIRIHKVTENGDGVFGYTTSGGLSPSTFNLSNGQTRTYGPDTVLPGNYSVTESTLPSGWTLKNLVCTASGNGTSTSTSLPAATASITMAPEGVVDCTYTNLTKVSPTISTSLSDGTVSVGDSVHDSATLTGATADAGGTVTYTVYTDNTCTLNPVGAGTKTVTGGAVPDSDAVTFNNAGTFFWQAVYSGDANNKGATSDCTSEKLVVKASPAISTSLSASTVNIGDSVHDSATLTGATADAGGTVTYTVYSDNSCTLNPVGAGTKTVTGGIVPGSDAVTFNNAGTFFWQAVYSGDASNNGATSDCTSETLVVQPNTPGISTAQHLIPNDDATINGATSDAGGKITFSLYRPGDTTCSGPTAFTQQLTVSGDGTYKTTNNGADAFVASTEGTWRWQVTYSGDANNVGNTSACGVENFTITN